MIFDIYIKDNVCICPKCSDLIVTNNFINTIYCNSCNTYFKMTEKPTYQYNEYLFEYEIKE